MPDASVGNYVGALDPDRHVVAARRNSKRHRVADNLLGEPGLCPSVRITGRLREAMDSNLAGEARALTFICPRPEDVPDLMNAWIALTRRIAGGDVDPVVAAAVSSFAFVFIHPTTGEAHTPGRHMVVKSDSAHLYRHFDATVMAEYLYDRVADSVRHDLREELDFVAVFDQALGGVRKIVDMPDRRASLLVRLCMQNGGRLAARKRARFAELTDDEVAAMEDAVLSAMSAGGGQANFTDARRAQ